MIDYIKLYFGQRSKLAYAQEKPLYWQVKALNMNTSAPYRSISTDELSRKIHFGRRTLQGHERSCRETRPYKRQHQSRTHGQGL